MTHPFKVGDRIRLTKMDNDPDPIPVGTTGRIKSISDLTPHREQILAVSVNWDIDRHLSLSWPEDEFDVIEEENTMKELVFYNKDCAAGFRSEIIRCDADSVERIVQWYGGFHAGDRVTLHIDGVIAKLDLNLELVT
jgi:hypothetical protein